MTANQGAAVKIAAPFFKKIMAAEKITNTRIAPTFAGTVKAVTAPNARQTFTPAPRVGNGTAQIYAAPVPVVRGGNPRATRI
ncbi:MAG: hypothetical protein KGJ13_06995 [Patescibacteria group bacterium]|nr:hypothetical protein [Patescibacteria group bacterium]